MSTKNDKQKLILIKLELDNPVLRIYNPFIPWILLFVEYGPFLRHSN
jgi:hypothetical protein